MHVQIYTAQTSEEALTMARTGVDMVGLTPSSIGLPGEITDAVAAECVQALKGHATSVALSVSSDLEEIAAMVRTVQPDIVHLCAEPGAVSPADVAALRTMLGDIQIMQAIAMTGPEAVDVARSYESVSDYLILDSVTTDVQGIGAAGITHDWAISAAIVEAVDIPVILAGGLGPDNVAEAIEAVNPWGVDSLTRTNRPLPQGGFVKDIDLVGAFAQNAQLAAKRGE